MYFAKIENVEDMKDGNYHVTCKCPLCNKSLTINYKEPEMVAFETAYDEGIPLGPSLEKAGIEKARREFLISGMCFDCQKMMLGIKIDPEDKKCIVSN